MAKDSSESYAHIRVQDLASRQRYHIENFVEVKGSSIAKHTRASLAWSYIGNRQVGRQR